MDTAVDLLIQILHTYSPSGAERQAAERLVQGMRERGLEAYVDEVGNAVGRVGHGARQILLLGHIDTVAGVIPVQEREGQLYGRGAVDAKGPLVAFVTAAARLAASRLPAEHPETSLIVVGAVEEESASSRGARHLQHQFSPAHVVVGEPSGWDSLTIGYKGRLLIHYLLEREIKHTARYDASASEDAVEFWARVRDHAAAFNQERKVFDRLDASLRRINSETDGLTERVEQLVGLRLPLNLDPSELQDQIRAWAGEARLAFSGEEHAVRMPKNSPLIRAFLASIRAQGGTPSFKVKTGTSDLNVVARFWDCPMLAYGPGDSSLDHTPHEHLDLAEFARGIDVLEGALHRLWGEAGP